jgi:hypothetical protein
VLAGVATPSDPLGTRACRGCHPVGPPRDPCLQGLPPRRTPSGPVPAGVATPSDPLGTRARRGCHPVGPPRKAVVGDLHRGRAPSSEGVEAAGKESRQTGGGSGGMGGWVAVRHFDCFPRATPQGWGFVGRFWGWRPPPGGVGNYAQIQGTGLAQEVLEGWVPVRVRIAPARCLTGWTRDGWDCPGGLASAGSPWVSGGFFSDLQEVPLWQECARVTGSVACSGRPGRRSAMGRRSALERRRPRQAGGEAEPRQAGGEADPRQAGGEAEPGRQTCAFRPAFARTHSSSRVNRWARPTT